MAPRNPPKISIYFIAGHEAQFIGRALAAFKPYCDEIIVALAQGNRPDDGTREIAEKAGATVITYHNSATGADWPHVDNFAHARNCALNACTGDYAVWFDCDDLPATHLDKCFTRAVEAFEKDSALGIYAGVYSVLNAKLSPVRERMVRRLPGGGWSGTWHYAVHEALLPIAGLKSVGEQNVWCEHHCGGYKPNSADRNLRILGGELSQAGKYAYYYQQELFLGNKRNESGVWSRVAAYWPKQEPTLQYEAMCNYAAAHPDREARMRLYAEAHQLQPGRREALYYMAREEASVGRWGAVYYMLKAAMVQPDPGISIWNCQRSIYDFECIDLYIAAARMTGDMAEVEKITASWRKQSPVKISILHATRGRPQEAINARVLWMKKASRPQNIEWIFSCDNEDPTAAVLKPWNPIMGEGSCVAAWNRAADKAQGEILIQASDDWDPPLYWDTIVTERLGDTSKPKVLAISDGHRTDELLCMAILTKARLIQQSSLFANEYDACSGIFSDNEFSHRAKKDGVIVSAIDVVFTHNNPMFTGAVQDAEFKKHNAKENYVLGEKIFKERNP